MKNKFYIGILLMLSAALLTTFGQMHWKMATAFMSEGHGLFEWTSLFRLAVGCVLYAGGAVLMIVAFRFGEVSLLHPLLSASYVASFIVGYFVFTEDISVFKIIGVALIMAGLFCIAIASKKNINKNVAEGEE